MLDFLFAMMIVAAVSGAFFALSATLSVVEAAQYIAFATSRSYFAAHLTQREQLEAGKKKFRDTKNLRPFRGLFDGTWFTLNLSRQGADPNQNSWNYAQDYDPSDDNDNRGSVFIGPTLEFGAPVLSFEVPGLGRTGDADTFVARVNSFLGREPNSDECKAFIQEKWRKFKEIFGAGSKISQAGAIEQINRSIMIEDNGC